jgi:glutaredoxin
VIYGADWCEACAVAKEYMSRRSIPFVEHDVETDEGAKSQKDATLTAAGLPLSNNLPVIDVRGTVTTGFMPCVLDAAWSET